MAAAADVSAASYYNAATPGGKVHQCVAAAQHQLVPGQQHTVTVMQQCLMASSINTQQH
jgi:hypothetical protein